MKGKIKIVEAIRIKISLVRSNPLIWREILVPRDTSFYKLHHTIQIAMGWTNSHLFEFAIEGYRIGEIYDELEGLEESHIINARAIKLIDLVDKEGEEFKYEYDFGDGWAHLITLENYESFEPSQQLPFCISGALKCPPEDCGGIFGFYDLLSILADKHHLDYKQIKTWVGRKFDPAEFDIVKVNKQLKNINKYIKSFEE